MRRDFFITSGGAPVFLDIFFPFLSFFITSNLSLYIDPKFTHFLTIFQVLNRSILIFLSFFLHNVCVLFFFHSCFLPLHIFTFYFLLSFFLLHFWHHFWCLSTFGLQSLLTFYILHSLQSVCYLLPSLSSFLLVRFLSCSWLKSSSREILAISFT